MKLDRSANELHTYQLKVRTLTHDLEMLRSSNSEAVESAESNRGTAMQLGKQLKQKEWELEDVSNTKDLRIKELENKVEQLVCYLLRKRYHSIQFAILTEEMEKVIGVIK